MYYLETKSQFDGQPIVVIWTKDSSNKKTGPMVQTWILRADMSPETARKRSLDDTICGTCPKRRSLGGDCYVLIHQAPLGTWRAYKAHKRKQRSSYRPMHWSCPQAHKRLAGKPLRLGAYGDPAAVPVDIWLKYFQTFKPSCHTSYTHAWKDPKFQYLKAFCMASVDTEDEARQARAMGWRYFRVIDDPNGPLISGEFACPASAEEGFRLTCEECRACNGNPNNRPRAGSVAIRSHGQLSRARQRRLVQVEIL